MNLARNGRTGDSWCGRNSHASVNAVREPFVSQHMGLLSTSRLIGSKFPDLAQSEKLNGGGV